MAFASRGLSKCEKHEVLALKWAVTDKSFDYLYGTRFTLVANNNPLTYVLTTAKLDAAGHRWLAALSTFDFHVQYRAGKKNQDADGLSRWPHLQDETEHTSEDEDKCIKQFISQFILDSGKAGTRSFCTCCKGYLSEASHSAGSRHTACSLRCTNPC